MAKNLVSKVLASSLALAGVANAAPMINTEVYNSAGVRTNVFHPGDTGVVKVYADTTNEPTIGYNSFLTGIAQPNSAGTENWFGSIPSEITDYTELTSAMIPQTNDYFAGKNEFFNNIVSIGREVNINRGLLPGDNSLLNRNGYLGEFQFRVMNETPEGNYHFGTGTQYNSSPGGYSLDNFDVSNNDEFAVVVPEPTLGGLAALVGAGALLRRQRRN